MFSSQHPLLRFRTWCIIVLASILSSAAAEVVNPMPSCQRSCGNVTIDYPFGIGEGCFMHGFEITCNASYSPPKPFLHSGATQHEVVHISVAHNQARVRSPRIDARGYHPNGTAVLSEASINLTGTPFVLNNTANKFTVTGCNSVGLLSLRDGNIITGCLSLCDDNLVGVMDGSCSGFGCCQSSINVGVKTIEMVIQNFVPDSLRRDLYNTSRISEPLNNCGYGFIVDQESYRFKASDLNRNCSSSNIENSFLVLDWVIADETCEAANKSLDTYACKGINSDCRDYTFYGGRSYRCNCKQGYEGNPYNSSGCDDIDECKGPHNPCEGEGTCINLDGGYKCKVSKFPTLQLVLGIGCPLFLLLLTPSLYICMKRRKLIKLKQKFFQQNGGLLLQQRIAFHESSGEPTKIFTTQELAMATENYAESRVIGQGGNGTVYRGILCDGRVVAVKKSKMVDKNHIEEFINEVVVLTQINHRNVVKLLGCCLETEVPLLVYEYVPNGSLHYHIHNPDGACSFSWEDRLRIAAETANALAYLHSAAVIPIIHRDVKSSNILLDERYTAKVSDFGASRLIPADQTEITTLVKGTLGYLDPEYFQTSQLTGKSDVYSFGVVLMELLTGQLPVSFARPDAKRNLSSYFIVAMQQDPLFQILEPGLANEGNMEQLNAVANLAMRCVQLKGEKRPTMREVVLELEGSRGISKHPWDHANHEETTCLLDKQLELHVAESSSTVELCSNMSDMPFSTHSSEPFPMNFPR
ncbi:gibberellin 20 oxidase 2 [Hibiscus syriacus]|uniref:Gibberellin 20 oxidase 2 n=1 Tax=Hibiscus syriacus TaxID=106335 RepID=A0A6A2WTD8_HIBSY|nr:wall-associated receptor kinase 3-like [Hibiscus syriacus]KAE8664523.1 gibberellin 20 oxidase 2 [Hibiscus syriacus]